MKKHVLMALAIVFGLSNGVSAQELLGIRGVGKTRLTFSAHSFLNSASKLILLSIKRNSRH